MNGLDNLERSLQQMKDQAGHLSEFFSLSEQICITKSPFLAQFESTLSLESKDSNTMGCPLKFELHLGMGNAKDAFHERPSQDMLVSSSYYW